MHVNIMLDMSSDGRAGAGMEVKEVFAAVEEVEIVAKMEVEEGRVLSLVDDETVATGIEDVDFEISATEVEVEEEDVVIEDPAVRP